MQSTVASSHMVHPSMGCLSSKMGTLFRYMATRTAFFYMCATVSHGCPIVYSLALAFIGNP